jgi:Na+/melibiose symporter-like transporter
MDTVVIPILVLDVAPESAKNTLLGALGLAGLVAGALVQVPVGWASDRTRSPVGRRLPYMVWGCVCIPIGLAGLAMPLNYGSLLVIWLFIQINVGIGYSPYLAGVRELVPMARMGASASIKTMLEAMGGAVVLCLAAIMVGRDMAPDAPYWLWSTLVMFSGVVLVSAGISALAIYRRMQGSGGAATATFRRAAMSFPESASMARLHPDLGWFVVSRGALLGAVVIFTTYGLFFLRDKVQVDNPAQALGVAIIGIGGMLALTTYPAGWVSDHVGRKPVLFAGTVVAVAATLAMMWVSTYLMAVLVASIIGGSVGVVLSAHWAMANDLGAPGREGQHMGIVNLGSVAGAAGAKAIGPLPDLVTVWYGPGFGYTALIGASALLFIIGGLLLLKVRIRHPNFQPQTGPAAADE